MCLSYSTLLPMHCLLNLTVQKSQSPPSISIIAPLSSLTESLKSGTNYPIMSFSQKISMIFLCIWIVLRIYNICFDLMPILLWCFLTRSMFACILHLLMAFPVPHACNISCLWENKHYITIMDFWFKSYCILKRLCSNFDCANAFQHCANWLFSL